MIQYLICSSAIIIAAILSLRTLFVLIVLFHEIRRALFEKRALSKKSDSISDAERPVDLYDVCYMMDMGCGGDVWRLSGYLGGDRRQASTPVFFDEDIGDVRTVSGSHYHLATFAPHTSREKVVEQIKKDIANGGYEIH